MGAWDSRIEITEARRLCLFHLSYLDGYAGFIDQGPPLDPKMWTMWTKTVMMPFHDSRLTNGSTHNTIYQSQSSRRRVLQTDSVINFSRIIPVRRFGLLQRAGVLDPRYLGQRQYGAISRQTLASQ